MGNVVLSRNVLVLNTMLDLPQDFILSFKDFEDIFHLVIVDIVTEHEYRRIQKFDMAVNDATSGEKS